MIVELADVGGLPRAGEALRMVGGLHPRGLLLLNESDCAALTVQSHAYVHTTSGGGAWSAYSGWHRYVGSWNGTTCDVIAGTGNEEIAPFPAASDRDKIRVVTAATIGTSKRSVVVGAKLGTCAPSPRPTGAVCDADDECASALCFRGTCCGSSAGEKSLCTRLERHFPLR